jgi:hypothetical protein
MVVVPKPLGNGVDLVDASGRQCGDRVGGSSVVGDEGLGRAGAIFRGGVLIEWGLLRPDEGVLVLRVLAAVVWVPVEFAEGAEDVEAAVAFEGFLLGVLAVAADGWTVAGPGSLVDGAVGASHLMVFGGVAPAAAFAADEQGVAAGTAVDRVAQFVAFVALAEDRSRVETTCFALYPEQPERAAEQGRGELVGGVEDGDEDGVVGPPVVVLEKPAGWLYEGEPLALGVAHDLGLEISGIIGVLEDGDAEDAEAGEPSLRNQFGTDAEGAGQDAFVSDDKRRIRLASKDEDEVGRCRQGVGAPAPPQEGQLRFIAWVHLTLGGKGALDGRDDDSGGGEGAGRVGLVTRAFDDRPLCVTELDRARAGGTRAGRRGGAGFGLTDEVSLNNRGFGFERAWDRGPEALDPEGFDFVGRRLHEV